MFSVNDVVANIVRVCVFLHLLTVNAILFAFERSQILLLITKKQESKSNFVNIGLNLILMVPAFFLSIYYPNVGDLAGICAGFATMLVIYMVPTLTYFVMNYQKRKNSSLYENMQNAANIGETQYDKMKAKKTDTMKSIEVQVDDVERKTGSIRNTTSQHKASVMMSVNESTEGADDGDDDMEEFHQRLETPSGNKVLFVGILCLALAAYGVTTFVFQLTG